MRHSAGPQGRQRGRRPQSRVTGEPQALPIRFPVWEGIGACVWPSEPQFWETEEASGETRLTTGQTEEQSRQARPHAHRPTGWPEVRKRTSLHHAPTTRVVTCLSGPLDRGPVKSLWVHTR